MKIRLGGKTCKLRFEVLDNAWGEQTPGYGISINLQAKKKRKLDTLIHEMLHEVFPEVSERVIDRTATEIATVLWRLNYRQMEPEICLKK